MIEYGDYNIFWNQFDNHSLIYSMSDEEEGSFLSNSDVAETIEVIGLLNWAYEK